MPRHDDDDPRCVGCGKRLRNTVGCDACGAVLCSEVCLRRHQKTCVVLRKQQASQEVVVMGCAILLVIALIVGVIVFVNRLG